jgi:tRNA pseudouridine55 synthase
MAEGILLILTNDENKKRHEYEDLEKKYESEIILGISTDSYDGLGLIEKIKFIDISQEKVERYLTSFIGKQKQIYPPYSSKAVNGKSLYWWARNKKLKEIRIPERDIEIYSVRLLDFDEIDSRAIAQRIIENIKKVDGDFRQKEIIENWENFSEKNKDCKFIKIKIQVSCSSGTYIRRIASDLGERLGSVAFAFSIKRVSVGKYTKKDCIKI